MQDKKNIDAIFFNIYFYIPFNFPTILTTVDAYEIFDYS